MKERILRVDEDPRLAPVCEVLAESRLTLDLSKTQLPPAMKTALVAAIRNYATPANSSGSHTPSRNAIRILHFIDAPTSPSRRPHIRYMFCAEGIWYADQPVICSETIQTLAEETVTHVLAGMNRRLVERRGIAAFV